MSRKRDPLPGFKHLIEVVEARGIRVDLEPPTPSAPKAGDSILGASFDPVLAAVYSRCNGGQVGDLMLMRATASPYGLIGSNRGRLQNNDEPRFEKVFRFAKVWSLSYYMATVPSLANQDGIQPVVYITDYVDKVIKPIASNVDRALGLYARHLDEVLPRTGDILGMAGMPFPYNHVDDILKDRKLLRLLEAGRFDELVSGDPDSRAWADKLLAAARARK